MIAKKSRSWCVVGHDITSLNGIRVSKRGVGWVRDWVVAGWLGGVISWPENTFHSVSVWCITTSSILKWVGGGGDKNITF